MSDIEAVTVAQMRYVAQNMANRTRLLNFLGLECEEGEGAGD